jgi:sirohydrochlorin cobaltochelatase
MLADRKFPPDRFTTDILDPNPTVLSSVGLFLVLHGSRNPLYNESVQEFTDLVRQEWMEVTGVRQESQTWLDVGFLEVHPLPLHQQIAKFADRAFAQGIQRIQVLPLFLLSGVHVREDIPAEVAAAQQLINPNITLETLPHLGSYHKALARFMMIQMVIENQKNSRSVWILFSHGSRRPGGNALVSEMANHLASLSTVEVVTSFLSVSPSLSDRVTELVNRGYTGYTEITILPYVLFPGELTKAIANTVTELRQRFKEIQINVVEPIGPSVHLAKLILSLPQH